MAIPINIDQLLNQQVVESNRIEFKGDYNPAPVIRTICAFANDIDNIGGGYIVLGVEEEDGAPVFPIRGIEKSRIDGILKKLLQHCHSLEPFYEPVAEPMLYQDKYVIVIRISGGFGRPYKAPEDVTAKLSTKRYYIRKFSSTVVASPEEEKELFYVSSNIPYDDRPHLAADINDLDLGLMRAHLRAIESDLVQYEGKWSLLDTAESMQLVAGPPEALKPRNVGLLMFSEHPEKYFRYARIEVVDIPDPTGTGMTEKTFTGPIQRQLTDALAYIKNYAIQEKVFKVNNKAEANRIVNYPFAAIEEILSNAVYHRSYQIQEPIIVRITTNAIEITSFPGFDRSITDENVANFQIRSRIYRNRRIGDFLKELHLIEGRNTGFPNAMRALQNNGSPQLSFEMNPDRDYLSVTIPIHPAFLSADKDTKAEEYEARVLSALSGDALTLTQLAYAMGYKGITAKMRKTVEGLINTGKITRALSNSGTVTFQAR
ncbi:MAG: putative DNA binding domain-containing protein [Clostridia bacterium]|nr:putative DNA binding domain-containing protein [Clostridia bacterium]